METKNGTVKKIILFLKQTKEGATPSDIARKTGINRMTISKYLNILHAIHLVDFNEVGMKKVYSLHDSPIFKGVENWNNSHPAKNMVDDFGFGVSIMDKDMKIKWFNKNMENWIGKTPDEARGSCCYTIFKNNKNICENCPTAMTLKDGKVHKAVQDGIDKNGVRRIFYLMTSPLYDIDKKINGVVEIVMELDNCEEIIKQSEALRSKFK